MSTTVKNETHLATDGNAATAPGTALTGWTCDEITPELCPLTVQEGNVTVVVHDDDFSGDANSGSSSSSGRSTTVSIHYWHYTRADIPTADGVPIVVLHGGPGWAHNYLLPLKQQACRGRDVYFFDSAGCGKSAFGVDGDDNNEVPLWLSDPDYYKHTELPALLQQWGLNEFHLFGNAFGGMVALLYTLEFQASVNIASVILSSTPASTQSLYDNMWNPNQGSVARLPPVVLDRLQKLIKEEAYNNGRDDDDDDDENDDSRREYASIAMGVFRDSIVRTHPFPGCLLESSRVANPTIQSAVFGPAHDFVCQAGTMRDWDITDNLPYVAVPVLIQTGRYDPLYGAPAALLDEKIPKTEMLVLERSGQRAMLDEPGLLNDAVADFFDRVEASRANNAEFVPNSAVPASSDRFDSSMTAADSNTNCGGADWSQHLSTIGALCIGILIGRIWRRSLGPADYTRI